MKAIVRALSVVALWLTAGAAFAEDSETRRANINNPVVGIMGAGLDGQMTRMLWDISTVTTNDSMRVLPMLGQGSLNNIPDLLYLRGVDGAMVQSDALSFYNKLGIESNLESKLAYIAPLGRQVAHLLARRDIASIDGLEGKKVNFGKVTSGSVVSAGQIFDQLSITLEVTNMGHRKALKALKAGEIDAMFWMAPPPASLLSSIDAGENLHFLTIPADRVDSDIYPGTVVAAGTYPLLRGDDLETVSTTTLLAAYNWPKDHPRRARVQRFANLLRANFDQLQTKDYHESFRTVDLDEWVPGGWSRFE